MANTFVFAIHGDTEMSEAPVSTWPLTKDGEEQAQELAREAELQDVEVIYTSTEKKAIDTAKPLAEKLELEILQHIGLGGIDRDKGELLSQKEYKEMKAKIFEDFDYSDHEWETARHASDRFTKAVEEIDKKNENKKILIVCHGTVSALYFARLLGKEDELMKRWEGAEKGTFGIVRDGKVLHDIVQ